MDPETSGRQPVPSRYWKPWVIIVACLVCLGGFLLLPALTGHAPAEAEAAPRFTDSLALYEPATAKIPVGAGSASLDFRVNSVDGANVLSGSVAVTAGSAAVDLTGLGPGYYELTISNDAGDSTTAVGIVEGLSRMPASSLFGTTTHPAIHNASLDHSAVASAVGTNLVRLDWRWEDAATDNPSVFTWDRETEDEINRLLARGIRPTLVLAYHGRCDDGRTPSTGGCINQYVNFVRATATKYGADVEYAIYNEFNTETNTSKCGRTPDCYVKLLRPAAQEIRRVAPGAIISGPALGGLGDWWAPGGSAYSWFERFVALGGHKYVDVVTIHNYSLTSTPEGFSERAVANARLILAAAGSTQPVVFEEGGYNTVAGGQPETVQAAYLVRDAAAVLGSGAIRYMHYNLIDNWNAPANPEANFGLFHHPDTADGRPEPKPAAVTHAVLSRFLDGAVAQGNLVPGEGARSSAFQLPDGSAGHVVWSPGTMQLLLIHGGGRKSAMDIYGRAVPMHTEGDATSVGIGGVPILLRMETPGVLSTH